MEISVTKERNYILFELKGNLDLIASEVLEQNVDAIISDQLVNLLIDFTNVEFINSAGLRGLFIAANKLKLTNGKLLIFSLQPHVNEIFVITGFNQALNVFDTKAEAIDNI
jgi:anti-anti-sigma factor